MNDKLAIDVVLLPPDDIMDTAIKLNKRFGPAFELNKSDRLPHITLFQCVVNRKDMREAYDRLEAIASNFPAISLEGSTDIHPGAFLSAGETSDFVFRNEGAIHNLHARIISELQDLASFDAESEHFFDPAVRQKTLDWVKDFLDNAAFDKFHPHITLGVKNAVRPPVDINFVASRLAVCHLGDYNTCRKILFETKLA